MKKNVALLIMTIFLLSFISVAYASFSSTLTISGEGTIETDSTPPTCGAWYLRESSLSIQDAYNQDAFINPGTNNTWTNTNKKLFVECYDNMEGSLGCVNVIEITDAKNRKRYFKEAKEYTESIATDSEVVTVTLQDAYSNETTCTLPVGGSNPYIRKEGPSITITQSAANKFTYSATDDLGIEGYMVTLTNTQPSLDDEGWVSTPSEVTIDEWKPRTYYIWAKNSMNISYETVNTVLLTKDEGAGTTLTLKYGDSNGAALSTGYILSGTDVYVEASLSSGYKDLVLKKDLLDITSGTIQTITSNSTISTSATINAYTITYMQGNNSTTEGATVKGTQTVTPGEATALRTASNLGVSAPTGWVFAGWGAASNTYSSDLLADGATTTSNSDRTLYAVFKKTYTVKSGSNGGTTSTLTQYYNPYKTTYVSSIKFPVPTEISGWSSDGYADSTTKFYYDYNCNDIYYNCTAAPAYNKYTATNVTMYATYYRSYRIYCGKNSVGTGYRQYLNVYNNTVNNVDTNSENITNWTFLGWRTDTSATTASLSEPKPAFSNESNRNLYCVYKRTLTFYSGLNKSTSSTATQYYNSSQTLTSVSVPALTGISTWNAKGYTDSTTGITVKVTNTGTSAVSTQVGVDVGNTLYGVYNRSCQLQYISNGGSGSMSRSNSTATFNINNSNPTWPKIKIKANSFTPPSGKTFSKWRDSSNNYYNPGEYFQCTASNYNPSSCGRQLYAVWQ